MLSVSTTNDKYTIDSNSRFGLKIQYPKTYAGHLNIQLLADSIVSGKTINGSISLGLADWIGDIENGIALNLISVYGASTNCNDGL